MFDKTKKKNKQQQKTRMDWKQKKKMMKNDNLTKDEAEPINQHSHLLNGSNDN